MKWILILLVGAVFVSALQLVLVRHENRMLFTELQKLQQQHDALIISFGQLQLEQSTLADLSRIERIAREQLDMTVPSPHNIVIITP